MALESVETTQNNAEISTQLETPKNEVLQDMPLTPEAEAALLGQTHDAHSSNIEKINSSQSSTQEKLSDIYSKLGISPKENTVPSIQAQEEKKQKILAEQEEVKKKLDAVLVEVKRKEQVEIEKRRILNELLAEIAAAVSSKADNEPIETFVQNFQWKNPMFTRKSPVEISEIIKRLAVFVVDHKEITEEDLKKVPDIEADLEKNASAEAEENIIKNVGGEKEQILENNTEKTIGYEGKQYSPEELLTHVEAQNQAAFEPGTQEQNK